MIKAVNINAIIGGLFTFGILTLLAFLYEMDLFHRQPFYVAFGIHLIATFVRYSIATLVALIEVKTNITIQAIVSCFLNLLLWSILVITIAPNQYKEKAAVIGVDLIIGLIACSVVATYKTNKMKSLPNNAIETDPE
jgi:hypothetical protein